MPMSEAAVYCDPMDADARADSTVPFFWNGRLLQARVGDTLAIALWRNGIRSLDVRGLVKAYALEFTPTPNGTQMAFDVP